MRINKAIRVSTAHLQGEGSYVELRPPKWGLLRELQQAQATGGDGASAAFAERLIAACVTDWNWTDDQGQALPLPRQAPEVIQELDVGEVAFLVEEINRISAPGN